MLPNNQRAFRFSVVFTLTMLTTLPAASAQSLHETIDKHIADGAGGALSIPADDSEFLQRGYLDLAGKLPSAEFRSNH